jgi:hypothetical protein
LLGEDVRLVIGLLDDASDLDVVLLRDAAPVVNDPVDRTDGNVSPFGDLFDGGNGDTSLANIVINTIV